ncbi:MAG TPA: LPS export ABC transporter periplasmic protein LptC [Burkholderiaceae bacterium]|jgi:lipopolysaccharide export system protein LptC|nr:LPS export ABC transporter periplasmic protein LptC [Burkholderiaceae bacterium]
MRDRIASVIAIVLLALVTATSYWYSRSLQSPATVEAPLPKVDADADQVTLIQFDSVGRAKYKLFAERMTHYVQTDNVDLVRPRLVSLRPDEPRVEAVAQLAHVENDGERIRMSGDVVLTRASPPGQPPLRVSTQMLFALPDRDRYWTDLPVLVDRGTDSIRARGMELDNIARRVEFLADVVDTITPQQQRK